MKTFVGGPTQLSGQQIRLRGIFSVERILASRGFCIDSEGSAKNTVLEKEVWSYQDLNRIFDIFFDRAARMDLLQYIEDASHLPQTVALQQLATEAQFRRDRQRYSNTFEWFIGELLVRKFMAFSSSFGVTVGNVMRNSDNGTAGDYDVLSVLGDMNLLYLECKTGKCTRHSILNSIERSIALHSIACVMFLGAGLSISSLTQQLAGASHPRFNDSRRLTRLSIKGMPGSEIFRWSDCYFIGAGERDGEIEQKLRAVMRVLAALRASAFKDIEPGMEDYSVMGYECADVAL